LYKLTKPVFIITKENEISAKNAFIEILDEGTVEENLNLLYSN